MSLDYAQPTTPHHHAPGNFYTRTPLYIRILIGLVMGVLLGMVLMPHARDGIPDEGMLHWTMFSLDQTGKLLLRLLSAIAPPLILVAVIRALVTAEVKGRLAGRMFYLLVLNTVVAILIGLFVANILRPGQHARLNPGEETHVAVDPLMAFLDNVPRTVLEPFVVEGKTIGVIMIAVAVGLAVRGMDQGSRDAVVRAMTILFELTIKILHWVIQLVPLAVMAKVAYTLAKEGFAPFKALAWFIVAVILALLLQAIYYLTRVKLGTWVSPIKLIRGTRDALVMAFSTASSTATMPVTYECLKDKVGLRPQSASLGALVGSNFNNDGTALYEAMAALFVAQLIGVHLNIVQQLMVVITSVVAAVGAAGIPEAGLVTMTLVFHAVGLPATYIPLLLPVDWFLDRCRTAINVMGDMNVSCMLDGKTPEKRDVPEMAGIST
jgi:Na+/H+-dicarboxylate symporter